MRDYFQLSAKALLLPVLALFITNSGFGQNNTNNFPPTGNIRVSNKIMHTGDVNTFTQFNVDRFRLSLNGEFYIDGRNAGNVHYLKLGDGGNILLNFNDKAFINEQTGFFGIGTPDPKVALHVEDNSGLLANGSLGFGSIPVEGGGTRMMWYPGKAAFRAGYVSNFQWDDFNVCLLYTSDAADE